MGLNHQNAVNIGKSGQNWEVCLKLGCLLKIVEYVMAHVTVNLCNNEVEII